MESGAAFVRGARVAPRVAATGPPASTVSARVARGDVRRRAGAGVAPACSLPAGLPPVACIVRFDAARAAGLSCFAAVRRDAVFLASASSPVFARGAAVAPLAFAEAGGDCTRLAAFVFADPDVVRSSPVFAAFAVFFAVRFVSAAWAATSPACIRFACTFRARGPAGKPLASMCAAIDIPTGNTESSVRIPAASSRFCAAVSRFTQYSARDAIERSGSGNDASTARGLRERV
ncbi:hypothetical protein [Burkholderia sp. AU19243]|uniref:hypothetical protein n=1 Tax=Burkholderia sp. AU19243 TaxID=2824810 RepID=UPI0032C21250